MNDKREQEVIDVNGKAKILIPIILAIALIAIPTSAEEDVKISVLRSSKFTNETYYMLDTSLNKLEPVNTSLVQVLDTELKDLDATDNYQPVVVLTADPPTVDITTNESITYAWLLTGTYGDAITIGVADVNTTDNTLANLSFFKISPASGDIAVVRTNHDVVVMYNGIKLSIPLENYTSPKILIYTDGAVSAQGLNYMELRALRSLPRGFVLLRSGSGEAIFTISSNNRIAVWFDEEHDVGDVDLFIYDISDPDYSSADLGKSWSWHRSHATRYIFADAYPQTTTLTASGSVKFVVKRYSGNSQGVSWRVGAALSSPPSSTTTNPPTSTTTSSTTSSQQTHNSDEAEAAGLLASLRSAYESSPAMLVMVALVFLLLLAVLARP